MRSETASGWKWRELGPNYEVGTNSSGIKVRRELMANGEWLAVCTMPDGRTVAAVHTSKTEATRQTQRKIQ